MKKLCKPCKCLITDKTSFLHVQVSYSILVFFSGMFITVEGFNGTGAPAMLWKAVEPYSRIDTKGGEVILSIVVTFFSNVASNVPTGTLFTDCYLLQR